MNKYVLNIYETITKSHEVTIETDKDVDVICDEIESHINGINSVWNIQYIDGVTLVKITEDEDGDSEFEVISISDDRSFYEEVIE